MRIDIWNEHNRVSMTVFEEAEEEREDEMKKKHVYVDRRCCGLAHEFTLFIFFFMLFNKNVFA